MILGPGGAGKSELAVAISRRTGLPVVHLDHVFWRPGWKPAPPEESARDMVAAVAGERWILDGNFLDLAFLRWIWRYPRHDRPSVLQLLAGLDAQVDVGRLRTCADVRRFMEAL